MAVIAAGAALISDPSPPDIPTFSQLTFVTATDTRRAPPGSTLASNSPLPFLSPCQLLSDGEENEDLRGGGGSGVRSAQRASCPEEKHTRR